MSENTSDAACLRTMKTIFAGLLGLFVVLIVVARTLVY